MGKLVKNSYFEALYNGSKVPRKIKKHFLGTRISSSKLNRLLKNVKLVLYREEKTDRIISTIQPYAFCPNCGCTQFRGVYRPGYYPEVWNSYYCLRCKDLVAYEDNSPFTHVLDEYLYEQYEKQIANRENLPVYKYPEFEGITIDI